MAEETLSALGEEVEPDVEKLQYMTFRCQDEIYGISLDNVSEIIGLQQYTEIPETPDYIKGLMKPIDDYINKMLEKSYDFSN